jgi:adenylate cyclase
LIHYPNTHREFTVRSSKDAGVNETESQVQPSTDILSIAGWEIHSSRNLIEKGEQSVRLQPRTMAVLTCLVESPGEVITRQQLEDSVWPNMVVGYDALSHTITKLRKAFDDDPKNPGFIETIPKVGYRLIADVSHVSLDGESPAGAKRLEPRLAVILHADVVGSTALVQMNESLTHERIQNTFQRFSEMINTHHGIAHEIRGDALVAEFNRVSDCLLAALSFQAENLDFLGTIADEIRVQLRIGISMGEVVIADNTMTGAGVVLAQRLEQMAIAGGVCIQGAAYETVPKRLPFEYESLGEQLVKGFEEPVRAYAVKLKPEEASAGEKSGKGAEQIMVRTPKRRLLAFGVTALLILVGIGIAWWQPWPQREEPASIERMAFPLPDKPSIVVLPFNNISSDAEQDYFADGITENLITDLSKISGLFVVARNSSFSYKGQQVKVRRVAEELGVRYVMEGSVQRAGDQVRINAQLIDAPTGGHVWAERYDGSLADIFALQDQVTKKIVKAMSVTLTPQELEGLGSIETSSTIAHDAYLLGLSLYHRNTPADNAKAETHFKRAIEFDPDFKSAYAALAKVYYKGLEREYVNALLLSFGKTMFLANKNLSKSVGAKSADGHILQSRMALNRHQVELALRKVERALDISVNDVDALSIKATALVYSGQYTKGRKLANRIKRLDPAVIAEPLYIIGLSYFASGSYDKAADHIERALGNDGASGSYNLLLAASYGKLGMKIEAKDALLKFRETWIGPFWMAAAVFFFPFEDGEVLKHLADGFEAAGVVVRPPSRYLKLDRKARLTGQEIETLLFGHTIKGSEFLIGTGWGQIRTIGGKVSHSGAPIHIGFNPGGHNVNKGESWIDDDRLCNRWFDVVGNITSCALIFRDLDGDQNNYYMVTDYGPSRFQVTN